MNIAVPRTPAEQAYALAGAEIILPHRQLEDWRWTDLRQTHRRRRIRRSDVGCGRERPAAEGLAPVAAWRNRSEAVLCWSMGGLIRAAR